MKNTINDILNEEPSDEISNSFEDSLSNNIIIEASRKLTSCISKAKISKKNIDTFIKYSHKNNPSTMLYDFYKENDIDKLKYYLESLYNGLINIDENMVQKYIETKLKISKTHIRGLHDQLKNNFDLNDIGKNNEQILLSQLDSMIKKKYNNDPQIESYIKEIENEIIIMKNENKNMYNSFKVIMNDFEQSLEMSKQKVNIDSWHSEEDSHSISNMFTQKINRITSKIQDLDYMSKLNFDKFTQTQSEDESSRFNSQIQPEFGTKENYDIHDSNLFSRNHLLSLQGYIFL